MNDTFQDDFAELTKPRSRTHDIAERALNRREGGFKRRSWAVARPIDPRVVRVIEGPKLTMFGQRSHALFTEFLA